jgi:hypothetical protein
MITARRFGHRYPWADWLDGRTVILTRGVHFTIEPFSLAQLAMRMVRARGLRGKRTVRVEGASVRIGPKEPRRATTRKADAARPAPAP